MSVATSLAVLAATLAIAAAPPSPDPQVEALKQRIWASFSDVDTAQRALPAGKRATGPDLSKLYAARRAPIIADLWRIGSASAQTPRGMQALGLVVAWGEPQSSERALDLLVQDHADDAALAPLLEAGYGESSAPAKRSILIHLATTSHSQAVAGSSLYLLAQETLSSPAPLKARQVALDQLHRVRAHYRSQPTTLLGGDGHLGSVAGARLFREERLAVGARLPAMTASDLNGRPVSSAGFAGRYVLIDFWATWCPPCVAAFPELARLGRELGDRLRIVSISGDSSPVVAKSFIKREGADWIQWYAGPSGAVSRQWSNASYPYFLLVSPQGRIVATSQDVAAIATAVDGQLLRKH